MTEFLHKLTKTDTRTILAVICALGCFSLIGMLAFVEIPRANESLYNVAVGGLMGVLGVVFGYYFGSTKTESDKAKKEGEI